jgi:heme exporter protein A
VAETAAAPTTPEASAPAAAAPAIALRDLWRDYGDVPALQDVSLEAAGGSTLVVLGPNGSGKTTLLRILATLLRPGGGEVGVLGCELPRQAWRLRGRVGYLGHEPLLYRDLTALENLAFHARLHAVERPDERIAGLLDSVGLSRRAADLVRNLSAGMVQRLAVCRAVLHEPELLLLDEPHSHLDPDAAAMVEPLIGPDGRRTRVVVSHDVERALGEADRLLVLRAGGRVGYEGPAADLSPGDALALYRGQG